MRVFVQVIFAAGSWTIMLDEDEDLAVKDAGAAGRSRSAGGDLITLITLDYFAYTPSSVPSKYGYLLPLLHRTHVTCRPRVR
jgi:hypothetical protein